MRELKPSAIRRGEPVYTKDSIDEFCMDSIIEEKVYFERAVKPMSKDVEKAVELTDKMTKDFSSVLDKFVECKENLVEASKSTSSSVRDAAEKLSQGLLRIEKAANFDRLERYVNLLERAATAMTVLADLEKDGKLEKIAGAIR